jgi:hypothetical protein
MLWPAAASATGQAPTAYTDYVTATGATTATVNGDIVPGGESTTYTVGYGLASSAWCQGDGSGSAPSSTASKSLSESDDGDYDVAVALSGLTEGKEYCVELVATNASGTSDGGLFDFVSGAPSIDDSTYGGPAGPKSELIGGDIDPTGQTTKYQALYGLASSAWCSSGSGSAPSATAEQSLGATDESYHSASVTVSGLTSGSDYCIELVAANAEGQAVSGVFSFTAGAPEADTTGVESSGATSALVYGSVAPVGVSTTYQVAYSPASSTWCETGGLTGSPADETGAKALGATDESQHEVTVALSGLTDDKSYCADLLAANSAGSSDGGQVSFTAGAAASDTESATSTTTTAATVAGKVNPSDASTTYDVEYALESSAWCQSGGGSGSPARTTAAATLGYTDNSWHSVSVGLSGLTTSSEYCADLVSSNAAGAGDGGQVVFVAGGASVTSVTAAPAGATGVTVSGSVDPASQATDYHALYGLASSAWCSSGGESGSPAGTTAAQSFGYTDGAYHPVSVSISGLQGNTRYCAELYAGNDSGWWESAPVDVTTSVLRPIAATGTVAVTGESTATVSGEVDPSGQTTTSQVLYSPSSAAWCSGGSGTPSATTATSVSPSDTSEHDVSASLTGLHSGESYCAEVTATNSSGTGAGHKRTFLAGAPIAISYAAVPVSTSTAKLTGEVDANGQSTTYRVAYSPSTSSWCTSAGASGTPASMTPATTLGATDSHNHSVSVSLTGVAVGGGYCDELRATNASGTSASAQTSFTTTAPVFVVGGADATSATPTGATTATISGYLDPAGEPTTYKADYALATSSWCSSAGRSGSPTGVTTAEQLGNADNNPHEVTVTITGLTGGDRYCIELSAANASGTAATGQQTFTAGAPGATTAGATNTGASTASDSGFATAASQATTTKFEYSRSSSTWCTSRGTSGAPASSTTAVSLGYTDDALHEVSANLTGLTPGAAYCIEFVASNASATALGGQQSFTAGVPYDQTGGESTTGASTASLSGFVTPNHQTTTYYFKYALASSSWCTSSGASGSATTTSSGSVSASSGLTAVSISISGLTPGGAYCYTMIDKNGSGTATSVYDKFTAGVPYDQTGGESTTGASTASLSGFVTPNRQTTTYYFTYGPTTSLWCLTAGAAGAPASTSSSGSVSASSGLTAVSISISGLTPGDAYCYTMLDKNGSGIATSWADTFTAGVPYSQTGFWSSSGASTASLSGWVTPHGQSTTYKFEYGKSTSVWCSTDGGASSPAWTTASGSVSATSGLNEVSTSISGLVTGTEYCYELVATNSSGSTHGGSDTFVQEASGSDQRANVLAGPAALSQAERARARAIQCSRGGSSLGGRMCRETKPQAEGGQSRAGDAVDGASHRASRRRNAHAVSTAGDHGKRGDGRRVVDKRHPCNASPATSAARSRVTGRRSAGRSCPRATSGATTTASLSQRPRTRGSGRAMRGPS